MFKNKIIVTLIVLQLLIIIFLGINIFNKINKKVVSISYIDKNSINIHGTSSLKYFYEPKPNKLIKADPLYPFSHANNIMNNDGLNNSSNFSLDKPKKTYRIIALGDSFTYGDFVETKDNWPEQLQGVLNGKLKCSKVEKFEVINLGVSGYDNVYSYERYSIRGKKYNPDMVIWLVRNGDFEKYNEEYVPISSNIKKELIKSGAYDKSVKNNDFYPYVEETLAQMYKKYSPEQIFTLESQPFNELKKDYLKPLVIISLPHFEKAYQEYLLTFAKTHKDSYFFGNMTDFYENQEYYFPNDGHPTKKGYQIITEDIFNYLTRNKLIPCN